MTNDWPAIRYRDFYDVPRAVVVEWKGTIYLFDSLFDHERDDYQPRYSVYRLPRELSERIASISWTDLGHHGELIGSVEVAHVEFDVTRRRTLNPEVFRVLGL